MRIMNIINDKDWINAGQLAQKALLFGRDQIKVGASSLEVCKGVEQFIKDNGGNLAFPPQVSFNECAAHFCPTKADNPSFSEGDILKLDVGVEINGAIGDNALTVDLGDNKELQEASKAACENALKIANVGTKVCEIGQVIEDTIHERGFNPIVNLSGHGLGLFIIHKDPSIPNYNNEDNYVLQHNDTIAIEPFATTGDGLVKEKGEATIFGLGNKPRVRNPTARQILGRVNELPFAAHWFDDLSSVSFKLAMREIKPRKYPPLVEVSNGLVSQHEHSVLVKDGKSIITTKLDD